LDEQGTAAGEKGKGLRNEDSTGTSGVTRRWARPGLTAEGVVPPADGDAGALAGLGVALHVVAQRRLHAVVLAHVVDAVAQEGLGGQQRVAGLEEVGEDDLGTLGLVLLLLLGGAVGVHIWTGVRLAAGREGVTSVRRQRAQSGP